MFLRLYGGILLREEEIIGIFDLDSSTEMPTSRRFLREAEAHRKLIAASRNLPRSFIVTEKAVYFSHSTAAVLLKNLQEDPGFLSTNCG